MMARPCIYMSIFFVVLLFFVTSTLSRVIEKQTEDLDKLSRIREQLKKINKPAVKSINSPDGDIIDCVLFHDQPAFDLPELKDQKRTLELPEWPKGYNRSKDTSSEVNIIQQLWSASGEECPEGTVPILRITEQHLLRAENLSRFGQKIYTGNHEYATAAVNREQYYGTRTKVNAWAPTTESKELSLAQIWVSAGSYENNDLNTIEVGWQVYPGLYRDNNPRLFGYWTRDAYASTGCYNLLCPGFVHVDRTLTLGGTIVKPVSTYDGDQYFIELLVWKDTVTKNWWLSSGLEKRIGYWPASLFTKLNEHAEVVLYGGEVVNFGSHGHTTTQMGSGHFSAEGFRKAAYFKNIQFVNNANELKPVLISNFEALPPDHPDCYDITIMSNDDFGTHFYYGGPGKNPKCP